MKREKAYVTQAAHDTLTAYFKHPETTSMLEGIAKDFYQRAIRLVAAKTGMAIPEGADDGFDERDEVLLAAGIRAGVTGVLAALEIKE